MTQTDCFDCDFSENCDWNLILQNMVPMSPPCVAKAWHEKSLHTFDDMTHVLRVKLEGGGEEVARAKWDNWRSKTPEIIKTLTVGEFYENSKKDRDLM